MTRLSLAYTSFSFTSGSGFSKVVTDTSMSTAVEAYENDGTTQVIVVRTRHTHSRVVVISRVVSKLHVSNVSVDGRLLRRFCLHFV